MTPNLFQVKQEMCEIGHRIWIKGFCAGNEGNHSVRISDDRVLCTPTGISKGFLRPDQICMVDMSGTQIDRENKMKRTSEVLLHLAIYAKRPDIKSVIHSHPPHATAFAIANVPIPEGIHPEAEVFLGKIPTAVYTTPSYKELGEGVCNVMKSDTNTVLLGNHGSVSFADSLMGAYYRLEILDAYCRILLLTKQVGQINVLTQDEMIALLKVKQQFGLPDTRLACAAAGCVGTENQPFLTSFDVRPESASAPRDGGPPQHSTTKSLPPNEFEQLVQQLTDQIMAKLK